MASIHLRINKELREDILNLFDSLGLTRTEATEFFLEKVIEEGKLPFEVNAKNELPDYAPNDAGLNMEIDEKLKIQGSKVLKKLGMTPTSAIMLFYKICLQEKNLPFEIDGQVTSKIKVNSELHKEAVKVFKKNGLRRDEAIGLFLKNVVAKDGHSMENENLKSYKSGYLDKTIRVKVSYKILMGAKKYLDKMNIPLDVAINFFFEVSINEKKLPFEYKE